MSDNVREALGVLASKWATGSSDDLADDTYQRAFNAARYRCAQELRAALAAPSSESPAATGSVDEADRLDALRAQRSVVTRNYARDPSNENEAALYAICERVYAAERKVAAATGSGAATGQRNEAVVAKIREYVVAAIATCREAEAARLSEMGKRAENHAIMPMLREQHFAWGEKVRSYDALLRFIDDAQRGAR